MTAARSFVLPPPAADGQDDQKEKSSEADNETDNLQKRQIILEQVRSDQIVLECQLRAVMTSDICRAQALKAADYVDAGASILARRRFTFVDVDGASVACESTALADGASTAFLADASIFARIWIAITAVLAAFATETGGAFATVVVVEVIAAAAE